MFNLILFTNDAKIKYMFWFKTLEAAQTERDRVKKSIKHPPVDVTATATAGAAVVYTVPRASTFLTIKDDFGYVVDMFAEDIDSIGIESLANARQCSFERAIVEKQQDAEFMARRDADFNLRALFPGIQGASTLGGKA